MVQLQIFDVDSENNESPITVLQPGQHVLGRDSFSNCKDKRISRNHAIVIIENQNASLIPIHVNPCFYISKDSERVKTLTKDVPIQLCDGDKFAFLSEFWYRIKLVNLEPNDDSNIKEPIAGSSSKDDTSNIPESSPLRKNLEELTSTEGRQKLKSIEQSLNQLLENFKNNEPGPSSSNETIVVEKPPEISPLKRSLEELNSSDGRKKLKTIEKNLDQLLDNFKNIENQDFHNGESDRSPGGVIKKKIVSSDGEDSDDDEEVTKDIMVIPKKTKDSSDDDSEDPTVDVNKEPMDTNQDNSNSNSNNIDCAAETPTKTESPNLNPDSDKQSKASTSNENPKHRREKCWYGKECFRKNPNHRENFSHPGDSDYESDTEDDRPECAYGAQCYRTNIEHRRRYKHANKRPAPKPSTSRKRRRMVQDTSYLDDTDDEDPYGTSGSDATEPSECDDLDSDSDFSGSDVSEEERKMFKEAKKFLRKDKH